ncbi:glycosyltransferase [bacterium]|nr:glycosyltransferase [bacterium]
MNTETSAPQILIVVPCYNEEQRLPVGEFLRFIDAVDGVDFLFVNDGSRDGTLRVLRDLEGKGRGRFLVHDLTRNGGKAEAVRAGMLRARELGASVTGFWDADLATPLGELPGFLGILAERPEVEVVMGARIKLLGRAVNRKLLRHYIGRVFATVASNYLRLPVYDTQCGAKVFRCTAMLDRVLADRFVARWLFDVEMLVRFLKAWHGEGVEDAEARMVEVPLQAWTDVKGSKVRPIDFPKALGEFFKIMRHYGWKP